MVNQTKKQVGEAYAFFNCPASIEEINRKLPHIRDATKTPNKLELSLTEVKDLKIKGADPKLLEFIGETEIYLTYPSKYKHLMATAKPIKVENLRYAFQARYPNNTNERTAGLLGNIVSGVYTEYEAGKIFTGAIAGKDPEGEYGIWEDK